MASVLLVCTGNVCRSPIAEAMVRSELEARLGSEAPLVSSAGTAGWDGSGADPSSIVAAAERGLDLSRHRARSLSTSDLAEADLIVGMSPEHVWAIVAGLPAVRPTTFALKELVLLLEALPDPEPGSGLADRVEQAHALRLSGFAGDPGDEEIADTLGLPLDAFRSMAAELEIWCARLAEGLVGRIESRAAAGGD